MSERVPAGALGQRAVGTSPAGHVPDKSVVEPLLTGTFPSFYTAIVVARRTTREEKKKKERRENETLDTFAAASSRETRREL